MSFDFDRATAVQLIKGDPKTDKEFHFTAVISSEYLIGGAPNGGYITAHCVSAIQQVVSHPHLIVLNIYFLNRCVAEESVQIIVTKIRETKRQTAVQAVIIQDGSERVRVSGIFSEYGQGPNSVRRTFPGSSFDDCKRFRSLSDLRIYHTLNVNMEPGCERPFTEKNTTFNRGLVAGYFSFPDGRKPDSKALVLFADSCFPSLYSMQEIKVRVSTWVPTLSMTIQLFAHPAPGPVYSWNTCREVVGGFANIEGELWDSEKRLVGVVHQTAMVSTMSIFTNKL